MTGLGISSDFQLTNHLDFHSMEAFTVQWNSAQFELGEIELILFCHM